MEARQLAMVPPSTCHSRIKYARYLGFSLPTLGVPPTDNQIVPNQRKEIARKGRFGEIQWKSRLPSQFCGEFPSCGHDPGWRDWHSVLGALQVTLDELPIAGLRQQAVDLYRGDLLERFFRSDCTPSEEWALVKTGWLRRAPDALNRLAVYPARHGAYEAALRSASRQLELKPWREEAHRQAMRAPAKGRRRSAALAQFETCWRVLKEGMKAEPSEETAILYQKMAKDQISGPSCE